VCVCTKFQYRNRDYFTIFNHFYRSCCMWLCILLQKFSIAMKYDLHKPQTSGKCVSCVLFMFASHLCQCVREVKSIDDDYHISNLARFLCLLIPRHTTVTSLHSACLLAHLKRISIMPTLSSLC
jgi:hypothetical protein